LLDLLQQLISFDLDNPNVSSFLCFLIELIAKEEELKVVLGVEKMAASLPFFTRLMI